MGRVVVIRSPFPGAADGEGVVTPSSTGKHATPPDVRARRQWFLTIEASWGLVLYVVLGSRGCDGKVYG